MASFILIYSNFPLWFLSMNRYPDLATSLTFLKMNDCLSHCRNHQMSPHRSSWGKWSHRVTGVRSILPLVACWQWQHCHLCCILWVILLLVPGSRILCWCRRQGLQPRPHGSSLQACPMNKQWISVKSPQSAVGTGNTDTVRCGSHLLEARHPAKCVSMYVLRNLWAEASIKDNNHSILHSHSNITVHLSSYSF